MAGVDLSGSATAANGNTHSGSAAVVALPDAGVAGVDPSGSATAAIANTHSGSAAVVALPDAGVAGFEPPRGGATGVDRVAEWDALREWFASPPPLREVDLEVLRERLGYMGRARSRLAALEAEVVGEISRRQGDAGAEEILRRDQKRSRSGARKAVKTAAQLDWAPDVADKLANGAITPEAAGLILDAGGETPVDHRKLLEAAEVEADDQFRRTLKEHVNELTSEQELQERRERQRRRRKASLAEQADGMFHLFAHFDPLTGNRVRAALVAKSNELFRSEDAKNRATPPQRFADALAELVCADTHNRDSASNSDGKRNGSGASARNGVGDSARDGVGNRSGAAAPACVELIVLADYDTVNKQLSNGRLPDGTRLTEAETLAVACDATILPGIFNKHTNSPVLGRSQRKVPKRLRKRLIARDGGCVGCGAHHRICQVHHIKHWAHGGQTTLENTCLVCWRCHHIRIHEHGEEITRHPGGKLTLTSSTSLPQAEAPSRLPPEDYR